MTVFILGFGGSYAILEVLEAVQLGQTVYLYEFLGNGGVLVSPGAARFHAHYDGLGFESCPFVCRDAGG